MAVEKPDSETKIIRGGRLIDGNGGAVVKDPVILLKGNRIETVGEKGKVKEPSGATVIEASNYTVMPGMFDTHVHLASFNAVTFKNYRAAIFEVTPQLESFYALFHAQLCFEMGFTTVRDMGRYTYLGKFTNEINAVRNSINAGIMPGPRVLTCGRTVITAGHPDMMMPKAFPRPQGMVADGPWELRRLTREHVRDGCDWIKSAASGGGGSADEEPDIRNMTQEELDAIVDETHAFDKLVAVHCFTPESHRMCVKAGVDTIEHIVFTDDKTIKMIKDSGIPVVPTLAHRMDRALEIRREMGTPENVMTKLKKIQPFCLESFKKFHQSGIKLAMGTDTGYDPMMGENAKELEIYVDLGMTPMEAIMTATRNAAEALKLDDDLGTIEAGKLADIVVVDGDPLHDITVLQDKDNIKMVMKDGEVFVDKASNQHKSVIQCKPGSWKIIDQA